MLEVRGMTAALAAADVMAKAAAVHVGPATRIGDGLVTVAVHGDIAAVREALSAAAGSFPVTDHLIAMRTIGRPADDLIEAFDLASGPSGAGTKGAPST
jgi:microcompartment protein CcmL/EutN